MLQNANWDTVKQRYIRWWNKKLDTPIIQLTVRKEPAAWDPWVLVHNLDRISWVLDEYDRYCSHLAFELDAVPVFRVDLGPGIVAAAMGAGVTVREDTVWLLKEPALQPNEEISWDFSSEWFLKALNATEYAARRSRGQYMTGIPSHSGSLDLLSFLRHAENLLMDMKQEPEMAARWMRRVTQFWLESFHKFYDITTRYEEGFTSGMGIWAPGSWCYVQADVAAMISPTDFERFVIPDLTEIAKDLDYSIYHLDGPGQIPHVDLLLAMPDLDGIQWIPGAGEDGPEAPKWYPLLRKIQDHGKLLVLLDIPPKSVPRLFDNISPRNVLIRTQTGDPKDVAMLEKFL